jgi:hypothetical protein
MPFADEEEFWLRGNEAASTGRLKRLGRAVQFSADNATLS